MKLNWDENGVIADNGFLTVQILCNDGYHYLLSVDDFLVSNRLPLDSEEEAREAAQDAVDYFDLSDTDGEIGF